MSASGICLRAGETLTLTQPRTGISMTFGEGCGRQVPDSEGDQTPATTIGARAPLTGKARNPVNAP